MGKPPDPSITTASPRPDWYLMWYFAVLALMPHGTEQYFLVFGPLIVGIILIALPFVFNRGERSPWRRPWAIAIVLNCHLIANDGGRRGPDLSEIGDRLSKNQMILKIANGGVNMPVYATNLTPAEMDALVAFLQSRKIQRP